MSRFLGCIGRAYHVPELSTSPLISAARSASDERLIAIASPDLGAEKLLLSNTDRCIGIRETKDAISELRW